VTIENDQISRSRKKGTVYFLRDEKVKLSPFYSRRYFLQGTLLGIASLALPGMATAMAAKPGPIVPAYLESQIGRSTQG